MSRRLDGGSSRWVLVGLGIGLAFTQAGCPGGAELEHPEAWAGRFGSSNSPVAGSGGMSPTGPVLDFSTVACAESLNNANTADPASADFLSARCTSCHGKTLRISELDLRPDAGFAQRTKNVDAIFGGILCEGSITEECIPDSCPSGAHLIDSVNPASSWMLLKSLDMQGDCGESMPQGKPSLTGADAECLTNIVNAVAALP
jgi:hypothetical protein